MMRSLNRREARLVALALLLALLVLIDLAVIDPLVSGFSARAQQRQELAAHIQANDRKIAAIPRLRRLAQARESMAGDYSLAVNDSAGGGEALRARVQTAALAAGGAFVSGEDVTAPTGTAASRASVRVGWEKLPAFIASLENQRPYLTISSLAIGADDALGTGRATMLDVQIEAAIPTHPAPAR